MERLTKREPAIVNGKQIVLCENKEEDCNDSCMYGRCKWCEKALQKLKEYEDLEEQGLLLKLPCKIGDTLYYIEDYEIYHDKVNRIEISKEKGEYIFCIGYMDWIYDDFGKKVFLTKEEAEEALRKKVD